jgi:Ca2+:H+ antiporter
MDLAFPAGRVLIVFLAVIITGQVAGDRRSERPKGVQLLIVYLGLLFLAVCSVSLITRRLT